MEHSDFYLTFDGKRFADHTLPVEVLKELELFQRLVEFKAVEKFFVKHPDRKKLPKNFRDKVSLAIAAVEEGSAAASLKPVFKYDLLSQGELDDAIREAAVLYHANDNTRAEASASPELMRVLRNVGSRLRETETMRLSEGKDGPSLFRFGASERQKLIRKISSESERSIRSVAKLLSVEIDEEWQKGRLKLTSVSFGDFSIPIDPDEAKSSFDGNLHRFVQFSIVAETQYDGTIGRVLSTDSVELSPDPSIIDGTVQKLSGYVDSETSNTIAPATVAAARKFLSANPAVATRATAFPGSEGNVLVEYEANDWDLSLEFHDDSFIEFYGYSMTDETNRSEFYITYNNLDSRLSSAVAEREYWG